MLRQFDRLTEDFSTFDIEDVEVIGHEGEWVAIAFKWHTRGTGSGIEGVTDMTVAFGSGTGVSARRTIAGRATRPSRPPGSRSSA